MNTSHYVIFTRKKSAEINVEITVDGIKLENVSNVKFLGFLLYCSLNWKDHINYISKKVAKCIAILYKMKHYVLKETLKSLYYTLAYPYLTYCNIVWGNTCKSFLYPLIILQKRIVRVISGQSSRIAHTQPIFKKERILQFDQLHTYVMGQFMYNFSQNNFPKLFNSMFIYNSSIHQHDTMQASFFHIPKVKSNLRKRSLRYQGCILWYSVKRHIDVNCSMHTFKKLFKEFLISIGSI